jgi:type II secretory pathway pseudopilin PulG
MMLRMDRAAGVSRASVRCKAFTLAEVLAALVFMAIVIPVVTHGLSIASRAGASASRRYQAALVAERVLNEAIITTNWTASRIGGVIRQGAVDYRWQLETELWNQDPNLSTVRLLSVEVSYPVQGANYELNMSTLVDEGSMFPQTNTLW